MGVVWPGVPEPLALWLRDTFGARTFVETGTYRGQTAAWAASHFDTVVSIEAQPAYHKLALAAHGTTPNLRFLQGDSRSALGAVLDPLTEPAILWLDAHWSAEDTFGEGQECPVLHELQCANAAPVDHVILIDDARLFLGPPPPPHREDEWPGLVALAAALSPPHRPRYAVVHEDVIVAVPAAAKAKLIGYLRAHPPRGKARPSLLGTLVRSMSRS